MPKRQSTLDRPAGWARFLWFPGDVEVRDAEGKVVSGAEPKPIEDHLREMGLDDKEIAHAIGREQKTPAPARRTVKKARRA